MSRFDEILGIKVNMCHLRTNSHTIYHDTTNKTKEKCFTLIFVFNGMLEVTFGKIARSISKHEVFIWQNNEPMVLKSSPKHGISCYILSFTPLLKNSETLTINDMGLKRITAIEDYAEMMELFAKLEKDFRTLIKFRMQNSSIIAMKILQLLKPESLSFVERIPSFRSPPAEERINAAISYIHKNFKKRITIGSLARQAYMHPVNFAKLFRHETGLSPREYILERKIEKAKDFLLHFGEQPVTIASELGFHDYSHFFRVFKRITGKSPKEFSRS